MSQNGLRQPGLQGTMSSVKKNAAEMTKEDKEKEKKIDRRSYDWRWNETSLKHGDKEFGCED